MDFMEQGFKEPYKTLVSNVSATLKFAMGSGRELPNGHVLEGVSQKIEELLSVSSEPDAPQSWLAGFYLAREFLTAAHEKVGQVAPDSPQHVVDDVLVLSEVGEFSEQVMETVRSGTKRIERYCVEEGLSEGWDAISRIESVYGEGLVTRHAEIFHEIEGKANILEGIDTNFRRIQEEYESSGIKADLRPVFAG